METAIPEDVKDKEDESKEVINDENNDTNVA